MRHALLLQMPDALRLECGAYVSNQLRNLSGRLSAGVHALGAGSYRPRNFLFRSVLPLRNSIYSSSSMSQITGATDRGRTTLETRGGRRDGKETRIDLRQTA